VQRQRRAADGTRAAGSRLFDTGRGTDARPAANAAADHRRRSSTANRGDRTNSDDVGDTWPIRRAADGNTAEGTRQWVTEKRIRHLK
jgi:hypothetical protein